MPDDEFSFKIPPNLGQSQDVMHGETSTEIVDPDTGRTIQISHEVQGMLNQGILRRHNRIFMVKDQTGLILNADDLPIQAYALSYTGAMTPEEHHKICRRCLDKGIPRRLYIGIDGIITPRGNPLCNDCAAINRRNKKLYSYTFGLIRRTIF